MDRKHYVSQSLDQRAHLSTSHVFDRSSKFQTWHSTSGQCIKSEPSFDCEEAKCVKMFLTSSCSNERRKRLFEVMFVIKDNSISDECWSAFKCIILVSDELGSICNRFCEDDQCVQIIEDTCPDMLFIPTVPIIFGDIYFAYEKNDAKIFNSGKFQEPYLCYNHSRYDPHFVTDSKVLFKNTTCHRNKLSLLSSAGVSSLDEVYLRNTRDGLQKYYQLYNYTATFCNRTNMYQCVNSSKCISMDRLNDFVTDCPLDDDEYLHTPNCTISMEHGVYICETCTDAESIELRYQRRHISFQTICDGYVELLLVIIDGRSETDETECEQWQCDNVYTRCDGFWNCLNGADELGCNLPVPVTCSDNEHLCVSPRTSKLMYIPVKNANDGKIDCLGATDESTLCRKNCAFDRDNFYCVNQSSGICISSANLCDKKKHCDNEDDEQFCERERFVALTGDVCEWELLSEVEQVMCERIRERFKQSIVYFTIDGVSHSLENALKNDENIVPLIGMPGQHQSRCHRGLDLRVWLDDMNNISKITCLCPPSYYGDQFQYQNQRVSVTTQFRALSDSWETPFAIVISLIDDSDEGIIHSYEQFTYLSIRDCTMKFNNYLLYSTRPKIPTRKYAIRLDIYEKFSLIYRGSLLFPIAFRFLPVHHFSFVVDIPRSDDNGQQYSNPQCIHGRYIQYSNNQQAPGFCHCDRGWLGRYCNIPHHCTCSSDSLCIGMSADNRSICVCPMHRFGSRCLLSDTVCQINGSSICQNHGQCIPSDEYMTSRRTFTCICPKGFSGYRCEVMDNQIILSFAKKIVLSQSIFIHFIRVIHQAAPVRMTTFRTIHSIRDSVIVVVWSQPFHLVFIELSKNNYYLASVEATYNRSTTTTKLITSSDRCHHISEVFNQTIVELHHLRRIKYYHLACQNYSLDLSCFYDDVHLCFCYKHGRKRLANCFEFNHSMSFDCLGQNECENGGQCFQDTPDCPQQSMCLCPVCFYGRRCQLTTDGFGLSLDNILGYHILPRISIKHQPKIVKVSIALTMIFIIAGFINGLFAIMTFKNKNVREVGCGLYLFGSAITTVLITLVFGFKFWILVFAQMSPILNQSFLRIQCISLDFILRVFLNMDQWLNACVAGERAITVIQGTRFIKKKSVQVAKFVIVILLIFNIATSIYDPMYRHLIEEENDEKRIWCVVDYPSNLKVFNSVIQICQFFAPFLINLISAIILITKKSHQLSNLRMNRNRRAQYQQHRHLFIAPVLLVLLAVPRLIISFMSKCMKSMDDSWLFLMGYFVSFIPPILTFVIFILPSKFYKKEFYKSVHPYQISITQRLQLQS